MHSVAPRRYFTSLYARYYMKDQGTYKPRDWMGQVLLVHFLVTGLRNYAPVERAPPRTDSTSTPISTKKIYRILEIALRTAMVLNYLPYSMTCTSRGHARYKLWGPELLWKSLCLLLGWHDSYLIFIFLLYSDFSWCHGRTLNGNGYISRSGSHRLTGSTSRSRLQKA